MENQDIMYLNIKYRIHLFFHVGDLFSIKAFIPSFRSSVPKVP